MATVLRTADLHPQLAIHQTACVFDDFFNYTTGGLWATTAGSGSVVLTTGEDSVTATTQASTDNDFMGVASTAASFSFASGKGMYVEGRLIFANQASANANIVFGFASNAAVGITNGSNPATSMTSALILKKDGRTNWTAFTSNGAAQVVTEAVNLSTDGSYILRVDVFNFDDLNAGVSFSVNGIQLRNDSGIGIIHKVPYASVAAMKIVCEVGAGSANAQVGKIDYLSAGYNRLI